MEESVDFEKLYQQAQQEIASHQHTIRMLLLQISSLQSDNLMNTETDSKKKKAN
jgi:uncharacterized membrane protein YGL010W